MVEPRDSQLLKGVLPMLTLAALTREETYGYELVTQLREAGLEDLSTGTLYPVLTRLERDGLLLSRLVASPSGPARKYYRLSAPGLEALAAQHDAWSDLVATAERVLGAPRPSTDPPDAAAPVPAPTGSPR